MLVAAPANPAVEPAFRPQPRSGSRSSTGRERTATARVARLPSVVAMHPRRPSPAHQEAVSRRLALLSAELAAGATPGGPRAGHRAGARTRPGAGSAHLARRPPRSRAGARRRTRRRPPVPVPGRHAVAPPRSGRRRRRARDAAGPRAARPGAGRGRRGARRPRPRGHLLVGGARRRREVVAPLAPAPAAPVSAGPDRRGAPGRRRRRPASRRPAGAGRRRRRGPARSPSTSPARCGARGSRCSTPAPGWWTRSRRPAAPGPGSTSRPSTSPVPGRRRADPGGRPHTARAGGVGGPRRRRHRRAAGEPQHRVPGRARDAARRRAR